VFAAGAPSRTPLEKLTAGLGEGRKMEGRRREVRERERRGREGKTPETKSLAMGLSHRCTTSAVANSLQ